MNKLTAVLCTNGTGLWSRVAKNVNVIGFDMPYVTD